MGNQQDKNQKGKETQPKKAETVKKRLSAKDVKDSVYHIGVVKKIVLFFLASYILRILIYFIIAGITNTPMILEWVGILVFFNFVTDMYSLVWFGIINNIIISLAFIILFVRKLLFCKCEKFFDGVPEFITAFSNLLALPFLYVFLKMTTNRVICQCLIIANIITAIAIFILVTVFVSFKKNRLKNFNIIK